MKVDDHLLELIYDCRLCNIKVLKEVLEELKYDDTRINLQPIRVLGVLGHPEISEEQANCDHEWVTWTGLKGTVTDCTKCKRVVKS